jgi:hypothetical protein
VVWFEPYSPNGWEAEQFKGSWCFAAVTKAVRGSLLGDNRTQGEIAHDFCEKVYTWGGGAAALGGTRGRDVDLYLDAIGRFDSQGPIPYGSVDWSSGAWDLLGKVWGAVDLDGLKQVEKRASTDPDVLGEVAAALVGEGLVVMGTQLHYLVVYGYEIPEGVASDWIPDTFGVWDPTDASSKVVDLGDDYAGQDLTLVFA